MPVDPALVKSLFLELAAIDEPTDRAARLRDRCGADAELLARVNALLAANDRAVLDAESADPDGGTGHFAGQSERVGAVLAGKYKLIEEIGEGGMGSVFVAQQTEPVKRVVAVKVIKAGMDSRAVLARFDAERQALAMMDHPNIARVLDAGTTESGRPFFVMELVKGVPITQYCDERKLTPRQRLELFIPVCHAIQHAHQKGVIHRDIKPSNVLVAMYDDRPVPKVIDFGVAKAAGQSLTDKTLMTGFGSVIGTPEYMSPEQASLNNLDIDTRSDVYSLGVLLYELLTGSTPVDRKSLGKAAVLEILRIVREVEAPRPSAKLSTIDTLPNVAANRGTEPAKLSRLMKGELDWVVLKALEKDRTRRYETANGLARDIQRFLADELVEARSPTAGYRLRKFVGKHKRLFAVVASFSVLLVAGAAGGTWLAARAMRAEAAAREERDRTAAEAAVTRAVNDFMNGLFASANPFRQDGRHGRPDPDIRVRTVLDQAAQQIEGQFVDRPLVRAGVHLTISSAYFGLGLYAESLRHAESAYQIRRRELGPDNPETLATCNNLGASYQQLGRFADAERVLTEALESGLQRRNDNDPLVHSLETNLALAFQNMGKLDRAEEILNRSLEYSRRTYGDGSTETAKALFRLAGLYRDKRQPARAEVLAKDALERYRSIYGPEHPNTLAAAGELASAYWLQHKHDLVEPLLIENLAANQRVWGDGQRYTVEALEQLGRLYLDWGQFARAEPLLARVLEEAKRTHGREHRFTLGVMEHLGMAYAPQRKYAQAEPLLASALAISDRVLGAGDSVTVELINQLGSVYWRQGKYALAEPMYVRAVEASRRLNGPGALATLGSESNLANVQFVQGRYAEAEATYTHALAGVRALPNADEAVMQALHNLGELNLAAGRPDRAEQFLTEALAGLRRIRKEGHPEILTTLSFLAAVREEQGRLTEAETFYVQVLEAHRANGHGPADVAAALAQLGRNRIKQGKAAEAEPLLRESLAQWEVSQPEGWERFHAQSMLGGSLLGQKKFAEAEPLIVGGYEGMAARKAFIWAQFATRLTEARDRVVQLYEGWGKPEKAAAWRLKPGADAPPAATAPP
jgi:serine/threonine protein kinase/tetratricopeptide (TPR) repeat protein